MKGVILINAYLNTEEYLHQPLRLREEFEKLGVVVDVKRNDEFLRIEDGKVKTPLSEYDFCVYLDKDKYVLKGLDKLGLPLFNGMEGVLDCDDKMLTYLSLEGTGIPMPKTLAGLCCFSFKEEIKEGSLQRIEKELSYPIVVKESFGSLGQGVYLVKDRIDLLDLMNKLKCRPHLFQEYISDSYGKDVRVIVVGNKVLGGMLRTSNGDFRSNLGAGGKGDKYELSVEMKEVALKVAFALKLDYCGIDFLLKKDGNFVLCEVNSNAFFSGFEKVTGVNVAKEYAEYIIEKLQKNNKNG